MTEFQDSDKGEIQKASNVDNEIQDIKRNLDEGRKEMREQRWGYANGRTASYGIKERFGYQRTRGYEPLLSLNIKNPHKRDMAERQKLRNPNTSVDDTIGQR